ncbi:MAG: glycogen branching protein [Nevskia sp.]|nr:glycogen branching protein [Nevskia sp.]
MKAEPDIDQALLLPPVAATALAAGYAGDPFALLGPHTDASGTVLRVFLPHALAVEALDRSTGAVLTTLRPLQVPGLFAGRLSHMQPYRLRIRWPGVGREGTVQEVEDPYSYAPLLGELDLHLFAEGKHYELGRVFGAQVMQIDAVPGVRFAVWAPNARRVSVVGNFNGWDGRRHPMRLRHTAGVWELFIPRLGAGETYKYEILGSQGVLPLKADPVALATEAPPRTASVVADAAPFAWTDGEWMRQRAARQSVHAPLSIYEVHAASWMRDGGDDGRIYNWRELAQKLIPYVREMGFTHVELLPIMEHPFGGSWGYQPLSQFAPSGRFGSPADFAAFVDACHDADIGVVLDWVPAHFPTDAHGLVQFDGTHLYEHGDPREGFHQDWNTLIYNLGRREVHGWMLASALHWLEHFHIDGLRVDAVASMLYRDYSRKAGEWVPNKYGGRENLESIDFLRHLNDVIATRVPGAMTLAEESTAWPGVSKPTREGGLGFNYKWNMGWMHDTLHYIERDPVYRRFDHDLMTFGLIYAWSENFVLPISHDEVVHGKGSLIAKMPGDRWQKFANLRAYLTFMWTHPGKKLLFMGCEFGQQREWSHDRQLDWFQLDDPLNRGAQYLLRDLNRLYARTKALHFGDCEPAGFRWIVGDDRANSVFAYLRLAHDAPPALVACNLTPVPRYQYRVGVPHAGRWVETLNSDAGIYGGANLGNGGALVAQAIPSHGLPASLELTLPPLAVLVLMYEG